MPRILAAILLVAVLALGGGLIANAAYQAGVNTAVTTVTASGAPAVAPVVVAPYAYPYGWHAFGFGWGIFGLFAGLFFLFVVFALIRAIFWRGGPGRRGGWGGPGWDGQDGSRWQGRAHDTFDDWHRQAHDPTSGPGAPTTPSTTRTPTGPA
jgi:hypothetical protein